jgi:long-chain acyl-CoA synthetase
MNAAELAQEGLSTYGDYPAFYFGDRTWSSREHADYGARVATVLREAGVAPGDRVPVIMPNCPEVLAVFQGVWRLGAVIVPVTPQWGAREVAHVLDQSDAKLVVTSPDLVQRMAEARVSAPRCEQILVLGAADVPGVRDITEDIEAATPYAGIADCAPDDLAFLLYTSGTTGHPKGVMLTHNNIVVNHRTVATMGRMKERSQTVLMLPLSHSFGVLMMNVCYLTGCSATILLRFDARQVLETIHRRRVTRMPVVPTMLVHLINFPDRAHYDTSCLESVNSGAAILPNEVRVQFERLYKCKVLDGYGLSECAPTASAYFFEDAIRPGASGKPIPGVTIKVQDAEGRILPQGEAGEICIQGPNVMKGYWKNSEATRETLRGGWLHSGDVGYFDADGYLYLTDRIKDLIIKGGENISPREIEDALYTHPAVAENVCVGVPDSVYGENIVAVVALKPGQSATESELIEQAAKHVTKFKLPCRVQIVDVLPRNPNNKIDRKHLRQQLAEEAERRTPKLDPA